MKINKKKIEELALEYRKEPRKEIFKKIIIEVSDMVYNYPSIVFFVKHEECSDFFIYFIERLKAFIIKFDPSRSSFFTWFNIIIKSQCLNWLNKKKAETAYHIKYFQYVISERQNILKTKRCFWFWYVINIFKLESPTTYIIIFLYFGFG